MRQSWTLFALLAITVVLLAGCGSSAPADVGAPTAGVAPDPATLPNTVDVATVKALLADSNVVLFDVREQNEYDQGHISGITLIPLGQLPNRLNEIPKDKTVILTCRTGNRSGQAAEYLRQQGYTNVHNMQGGIVAWQDAGYPVDK